MWIVNRNLGTSMLHDPAITSKPVYFVNGKAQVTDEVGRRMAAKYPTIEVIERKRTKGSGIITSKKADTLIIDERVLPTEDKPQEGDNE